MGIARIRAKWGEAKASPILVVFVAKGVTRVLQGCKNQWIFLFFTFLPYDIWRVPIRNEMLAHVGILFFEMLCEFFHFVSVCLDPLQI